ncbi:MAG: hypothetical protein KGZ39_08700 [Simkania sp.]|nr:hypothetical protein [Simkania sp.]
MKNYILWVLLAILTIVAAYFWTGIFIIILFTLVIVAMFLIKFNILPLEEVRDSNFFKSIDVLVLGFVTNVAPWLILIYFLISLVVSWMTGAILSAENFDFWSNEIFWLKVIIWLGVMWAMFANGLFYAMVPINTAKIYQDVLFGSIYPKWPGLNWVGLLQTFNSEKNTDKHLDTTGSGDAEAGSTNMTGKDTMTFKWKVIWVVDITANRTANMIKYVLTTDANIQSAVTLAANMHIIQWIAERSADQAKAEQKTGLPSTTFSDVCSEYGIRIIKSGLEDLDYSETIREARKVEREMQSFNAAVKVLTDAFVPDPEAREIVKMRMLKNYKGIRMFQDGNNPNPVIVNTTNDN